jgi:hypothetical protein
MVRLLSLCSCPTNRNAMVRQKANQTKGRRISSEYGNLTFESKGTAYRRPSFNALYERYRMRILSTLICVGICLSFGCQKSDDNVSAASFHVKADELISTDDHAVLHVVIEASGERYVEVNANGELFWKSTFKPQGDTNTLQVELTFVATFIKRPDTPNLIKWAMQTKAGGNTIEHPGTIETEAKTLSEVIQLKSLEGSVIFGQDLVLGKFNDEPIVILVK